ncbi:pyridine nucleotide transhydrogenase [Alteromonas sp. ASW11-36]|uniref:Pyridine nucleotide transhydrogenase n=1 Tax=Alteromonas arenosi TaxID=3055817 RepID=A0ABT7SZ21_9ALTE|nr:pyridine nucleotide transhydrogenase [Alteromonas sp. ASW11-36]MDM7861425.1 pyridine nucleotide transhydrogenase [Alteromonas sp. ASW11-36]
MRKLLAVTALVLGSAGAHADANKAQAFDCMDAKTFEINSQCMANTINNNLAFTAAQQNIVLSAEENSGNAMATVSYFPELQLIEVVAHQDATLAKNTEIPKN